MSLASFAAAQYFVNSIVRVRTKKLKRFNVSLDFYMPDTTQLHHHIALTATRPVLAPSDSLTIRFVTINPCS